jgi:hypothetical protein
MVISNKQCPLLYTRERIIETYAETIIMGLFLCCAICLEKHKKKIKERLYKKRLTTTIFNKVII